MSIEDFVTLAIPLREQEWTERGTRDRESNHVST